MSEENIKDLALKRDFDKAMRGRQYGQEETRDARDWFAAGWKAMMERVCGAYGEDGNPSPNTINFHGTDAAGKRVFWGSRSTEDAAKDFNLMEAFLDFQQANQLRGQPINVTLGGMHVVSPGLFRAHVNELDAANAQIAALTAELDKWYAQASKNQDQIVELQESGMEIRAALDTAQADVVTALERARNAENRVTELEDELREERCRQSECD